MSVTRSEFIQEARTWLGTPWQHHQKCKGVGVDCVMFLVACGEAFGIPYGITENYYRTPVGDSLLRELDKNFNRISFNEVKPGDILVFKAVIKGNPTHVAFYTGNNRIIHADMRSKKVTECNLGFWKRLHVATFRAPSLVDD